MKVKIDTAKTMLEDIYRAKGADPGAIDWLVELSLEQDLTGNYFSGLEEGPEGIYRGLDPTLHETYDVDRPSLKLINGHGKNIKLIMKELLPNASEWARQQGQVTIGFKNCGWHGNMGTIAGKFAEGDLVCVYSANGGPATVPPYGGSKELFGTNPLAYAIPTSDVPIVFDAATSERPYGSIGKARDRHLQLLDQTYFDKDGAYTTDPNQAMAIIPFGGYKGSAINLLLDVLTGALVSAKSGSLVADEDDLGGFLLLIDPAAFGSLDAFKVQTDQIVKDILANRPAPGAETVRFPGYRAHALRTKQLADGTVEVEPLVWERFTTLHQRLTDSAGK